MEKKRVLTLDVLRGLTICLMIIVNTPGSWSHVYAPLLHAKWHGCTLTDLVFPSFLFVVGLSMSQSFKNAQFNKSKLILKILKRAALIFLIGLLLNWFPFYKTHISELRIFGVLQRIALSFLVAGIVVVFIKRKSVLFVTAALLLLMHWLVLYFGAELDPYSLESNVGRHIDLLLIGESHMYKGFGIAFDPEGILGTISGAGQVLLGFAIGSSLLERGVPNYQKMWQFSILAAAMFGVAKLWNLTLPINKPLWTGSYVLYTSAIVLLVFIVLIEVIEYRKIKTWTHFFLVFGKNPLFSYILSILLVKIFLYLIKWEDTNLYAWLYQNVFTLFGNRLGSFLFALSFMLFVWLFSYILYRKKIIIKV